MTFVEYLQYYYEDLLVHGLGHLQVVLISMALGTVIGIALGVGLYRRPTLGGGITRLTGLILTIPSLALYALLVGVVGLGQPPVIVALTLYSLLPIVRNTITGLRGVDPAIVESATGMGMSRWSRLFRVELPLAMPVIITGVRVSTMIIVGIATLGAVVSGPGFGVLILDGLRRVGSPVAIHEAVAGTLGVVVLSLLLDATFIAINRLTTSRGLRV